jgi:hypothetical protein
VGALPCMPLCGEGFAARVETTKTGGYPGATLYHETSGYPRLRRQEATLHLPCSRSVRGNDQDKQSTLQSLWAGPAGKSTKTVSLPCTYPTPGSAGGGAGGRNCQDIRPTLQLLRGGESPSGTAGETTKYIDLP